MHNFSSHVNIPQYVNIGNVASLSSDDSSLVITINENEVGRFAETGLVTGDSPITSNFLLLPTTVETEAFELYQTNTTLYQDWYDGIVEDTPETRYRGFYDYTNVDSGLGLSSHGGLAFDVKYDPDNVNTELQRDIRLYLPHGNGTNTIYRDRMFLWNDGVCSFMKQVPDALEDFRYAQHITRYAVGGDPTLPGNVCGGTVLRNGTIGNFQYQTYNNVGTDLVAFQDSGGWTSFQDDCLEIVKNSEIKHARPYMYGTTYAADTLADVILSGARIGANPVIPTAEITDSIASLVGSDVGAVPLTTFAGDTFLTQIDPDDSTVTVVTLEHKVAILWAAVQSLAP